jgi:hypothetical protein
MFSALNIIIFAGIMIIFLYLVSLYSHERKKTQGRNNNITIEKNLPAIRASDNIEHEYEKCNLPTLAYLIFPFLVPPIISVMTLVFFSTLFSNGCGMGSILIVWGISILAGIISFPVALLVSNYILEMEGLSKGIKSRKRLLNSEEETHRKHS